MPYVRISLMRAKSGQAAHVSSLLDQLVQYYERQPGYITGYRLENMDGSGRIGRIGIWEHEDDAERAAQSDHDLALRSQLNIAIDEDSHEEYSFNGVPAPKI